MSAAQACSPTWPLERTLSARAVPRRTAPHRPRSRRSCAAGPATEFLAAPLPFHFAIRATNADTTSQED